MFSSIFGPQTSIGLGQSGTIKLKCPAGKLYREGNTIKSDHRKGSLYFLKGDDGLLHVCWKEHSAMEAEDDLIVFPGEAELSLLAQCTDAKSYVLKFKNSTQRLFYWIQEVRDEDMETTWLRNVNALLAGQPLSKKSNLKRPTMPPSFDPAQGGTGTTSSSTQSNPVNHPHPRQNSSGHASHTTATTELLRASFLNNLPEGIPGISASSKARASGLSMPPLKDLISSIKVPGVSSTGSLKKLTDILKAEKWRPLLKDEAICRRLLPFLPEKLESTGYSESEIDAILRSGPFVQTVQSLDKILDSEEGSNLLVQQGLDPAAVSQYHGVEALLEALKLKMKMEGNSKAK